MQTTAPPLSAAPGGQVPLPRPAIQAIAWAAFIVYEQAAVYLAGGRLNGVLLNLLYYSLNIALFYSHWYVLRASLGGQRRRYLAAALLMLAELAVLVMLKAGVNQLVSAGQMNLSQRLQSSIWDLYRSLYFTGLSTLAWALLFNEGLRQRSLRLENARLEAERDRARLEAGLAAAQQAYHRQQLNPHLLFNTLNFIYSRVAESSAEGAECVLLLSGLMRYSLSTAGSGEPVPLEAELEQIAGLIRLNQLRFGGRCYLDYQAEPGEAAGTVLPLLLLTLTENIFKHGLLTDPGKPASLHIYCREHRLYFHSRNYRKRAGAAGNREHTGLQNTRTRLDHRYPGRHRLRFRQDAETYELQLMLEL